MSGNEVEVPLDLQSNPLPADFLPLKCDACSGIFCADHVAYAQHHCGSAYEKVRGRSEGERGRMEDGMQNLWNPSASHFLSFTVFLRLSAGNIVSFCVYGGHVQVLSGPEIWLVWE